MATTLSVTESLLRHKSLGKDSFSCIVGLVIKHRILILVGPTASGKSALAVELAKIFNGEVISADSRQVYKGLDIGTGKITKAEMQGVRHQLLDVASPKKVFTAQDFIDHATRSIEDISARGKLPIIAGGTGFYIDALVGRIALASVEPDPNLRKRLEKKATEELYKLLQRKDPKRAQAMATPSERNNKVRLIRALEIAAHQGRSLVKIPGLTYSKSFPQKIQRTDLGEKYEFLWIGIAPDMKMLDAKIRTRLEERLKRGMIQEARKLHTKGLSYKRMTELGLEYRSLARFLQRAITRQDLVEELGAAIRRYARKQTGYWKRNTEIKWFGSPSLKVIEKTIRVCFK